MTRPASYLLIGLLVLSFALVGCAHTPHAVSLQVSPATAAVSFAGQKVQFRALATVLTGPDSSTQDVTNQVNWGSVDTSIATIDSSGLATVQGSGSTTITASTQSPPAGVLTATATLSSTGTIANNLASITVIPNSQTMETFSEPTQFIAIGNYNGSPATLDLTNQVTWQSSDVKVATINSAGLAIGNNIGTTTITASMTNKAGALITGTATLTEASSGGGVVLPALSVYEVGLGSGSVDIPTVGTCTPATNPAQCTGNFVLGTTVTLTATPAAGSCFGGWSVNCTPSSPASPPPVCVTTTASCSVVMNNNQPVGAIFNRQ